MKQSQPPLNIVLSGEHFQEATSGRSKLAIAFSRWRLHTCCDGLDESSLTHSLTRRSGTDTSTVCTVNGGSTIANPQSQTVAEMWETSGGASGDQQDIYCLVIMKEQNDRLLPSELCDKYARDMADRINRRQRTKNIPIPMQFF